MLNKYNNDVQQDWMRRPAVRYSTQPFPDAFSHHFHPKRGYYTYSLASAPCYTCCRAVREATYGLYRHCVTREGMQAGVGRLLVISVVLPPTSGDARGGRDKIPYRTFACEVKLLKAARMDL